MLNKQNIQDRGIVKYNMGLNTNKIAFVFACPGQEELNNGKVVCGQTGENLTSLIKYLNQKDDTLFPSLCRYDYLITNASERIYFKGYKDSNRTLPYLRKDVYTEENIKRLENEISNKTVVICFGRHAKKALKKLKNKLSDLTIICVKYHLGMQGINHIRGDGLTTEKRIEKIAKDICNQI